MTDDKKPGDKPDLKVVPDAKAPAKKKRKPAAAKAPVKDKPVTDDQVDQVAGRMGHNSINGSARQKLRNFVSRIENMEEEKKTIQADISETYKEVKAQGFDTTALRKVIRERAKDQQTRDEQLSLFDLYWDACGI